MLKGKHILLGVTGGIAAYKIPLLVRDLKKAGAEVRTVMTEAAREFVTPLTLATLSGNDVVVGTFPDQNAKILRGSTWHIELAQWADVMLIAPATANVLAKLANGYADNAVTTLALALRCPLIVSPAMDVDMWQHHATQENVTKLCELGYRVLPPEEGELASGLSGPGRLPELGVIMKALDETLHHTHHDLKGRKILVTAGPTYEPLDPVRFIGNRSSGKMGFAIAKAAAQRGATVTLITGKVHLPTPPHVSRIDVGTAQEMYESVMRHKKKMDAIVMSAAVADFTPVSPSSKKIKKMQERNGSLAVELAPTKDILKTIGLTNKHAVLVGFALETEHGVKNATSKLKEKKLDYIVLNNPKNEGAGFDADTNVVSIISKSGKVEKLKKMSKFDVAHEILNRVASRLK